MKSYEELRNMRDTRRGRGDFSKDVMAARRKERTRRCAAAQSRAVVALRHAFPNEYRVLYEAAKAEVNGECGPLPGDDT